MMKITSAAGLVLAACLAACGGGDGTEVAAPRERAQAASDAASAPALLDPLSLVNPFIGTGLGAPNPQDRGGAVPGSTFPGAALPFGMVQFSPDTHYGPIGGTQANGGYANGRSWLQGFSLTHLGGTGCPAAQDVSILPFNGPVTTSPATDTTRYQLPLSRSEERFTPGYYAVGPLAPSATRIGTELSVSRRSGFARFSFPASADAATVILNVGRNALPGANAQLQWIGGDAVEGAVENAGVCGNGRYVVYFHGRFDRPWSSVGTFQGSTVSAGSQAVARAPQTGGWASFAGGTVQLRVAISYVSIENARLNLQADLAEAPDFEATRQQAASTWAGMLGRVRIASNGVRDDEVKFTTALYHALLHPNLFSDANHQYLGVDRQVHTTDGWDQYANFSGWDTYRAQMQLVAWLAPRQGSDMAQSLIADAQQSGAGFPRWPVANTETCMMHGDPGAVIVANMHAFGATGFDTAAALAVMERGANTVNLRSGSCETRPGLSQYLGQGYISGGPAGAVGNTLEYALADAAIGQFAGALGDGAKRDLYLTRAQAWKALLSTSGYMQPRNSQGVFATPFDPGANNGAFGNGSSAQYSFMVPHNMRGLIDRMGGNAAAIARLDSHFQQLNSAPTGTRAALSSANEQGVPWAYLYAGAPAKSQALVRRVLNEQYRNQPDGLMGSDDLGSLSAWYVWGALGLYPAVPGVGGFAVGTPLFPRIEVQMGNGHLLKINAVNAAAGLGAGTYIRTMKVDGLASTRTWLPLDRLDHDTAFDLVLDTVPPAEPWGAAPEDAPPSFDVPRSVLPSPSFATGFDDLLAQPDWVDASVLRLGAGLNVSSTRRSGPLHGGAAALRYEGSVMASDPGMGRAYNRLYDVRVPVTETTRLSYWILPDLNASQSRFVAVELLFDDGTSLRDTSVVDQNGIRLHPEQQGLGGMLQAGTWNLVQADLRSLCGKTIVRIGIGFEHLGASGNVSGSIDDLAILP